MTNCTVRDCTNEAYKGGPCHGHRQRRTKHGDVMADVPIRRNWRPGDPITDDPISYESAHRRARSARGRASEHECANGCGRRARHWSYLQTSAREQTDGVRTWSPDPDDYAPRCWACHKHADVTHHLHDDPTWEPLRDPAIPRTPVPPELARMLSVPTGWPTCELEDCARPAKRSSYGTPRRMCSKHEKDRETRRNAGPCAEEGCDAPRLQARAQCRRHALQGKKATR